MPTQNKEHAVSPKMFFAGTLVLPFLVLLGKNVPILDGAAFLMSFAQVPYLACMVCLEILIFRSRTFEQLAFISLWVAPFLMSAFMSIFLYVVDPPELRGMGRFFQIAFSVIPLTVVVAYMYVALSWGLFLGLRRMGFVASTPTWTMKN